MARHEEKPSRGELPQEEVGRLEAMLGSPYGRRVRMLGRDLAGLVVERTAGGKSGYCLRFTDGSWVICYVSGRVLEWRRGIGEPTRDDVLLLDSEEAGDCRGPLSISCPYAGESCDIAAEVERARGHLVHGVALGETCFNLVFDQGMELDSMCVPDPIGRLGLRVFWEQW